MTIRAEVVGLSSDEAVAADQLRETSERILSECAKAIVGQQDVLELLLIALLGQGHALLVGVPGLAKTLMIRTLADSMNLSFNRVQFTPDLMPSDITGTEMLQEDRATGQRSFRFLNGPIFANVYGKTLATTTDHAAHLHQTRLFWISIIVLALIISALLKETGSAARVTET